MKGLFLAGAVAVVAAFTAMIFLIDEAVTGDDATPVAAAPATHESAHVEAPVVRGIASYAGITGEAAERAASPAELPPIPEGDVVEVQIVLKDVAVEIAPGVKYLAWGFDGGAPGPTIHVRQGQKVKVTLTNGGAIPHSIDFHAARIAPDVAFADVDPGESISYTFEANDPGVYVYHCGTKPVLAHIANGMYGAIVVSPREPLAKADREYVVVASEWYLNGPGTTEPAQLDMAKARAMMPDWVTWNGYASQYKDHPLPADPGDLVRFYVADAGPSLDVDFHIVGTILDTVYPEGDMNPEHVLNGVQTSTVPAGGGAVVEVTIGEPGLYPFLSHSFASVDMGLVGLLKVGEPKGGASH